MSGEEAKRPKKVIATHTCFGLKIKQYEDDDDGICNKCSCCCCFQRCCIRDDELECCWDEKKKKYRVDADGQEVIAEDSNEQKPLVDKDGNQVQYLHWLMYFKP